MNNVKVFGLILFLFLATVSIVFAQQSTSLHDQQIDFLIQKHYYDVWQTNQAIEHAKQCNDPFYGLDHNGFERWKVSC